MTDLTKQLIELDKQARASNDSKLIVTDSEGYQAYWDSLQAKNRFMDKSLADHGHINLMFYHTPVVTKPDAAPDYHLCDGQRRKTDPIIYPTKKGASA